MNNLLIDIGNSDIKTGIGKSDDLKFRSTGRFAYSKDCFEKDFNAIFTKKKAESRIDLVGISVLNNRNNKFLSNYFKNKCKINPFFVSKDVKLPVMIKYESTLGNDRICNAAAAVSLFDNKNFLVIDFGTATTYTLILNKVISGGLIAPGIGTSYTTLAEKTSLSKTSLKFPRKLFTNTTTGNLTGGVLYQSLYSAERIITEASESYRDLFVIATGGYSHLISGKTKLFDKTDEHLVLKGINFIVSL